MTSGHTLRARMAMVKFFNLQAQAIAGFSSYACYPEILRISYNFVEDNICIGQIMKTLSDKNYELLCSVKAHVPTHRERRKELGINGSSDLVDLGTFRLIRRSSEESTLSVWHTSQKMSTT